MKAWMYSKLQSGCEICKSRVCEALYEGIMSTLPGDKCNFQETLGKWLMRPVMRRRRKKNNKKRKGKKKTSQGPSGGQSGSDEGLDGDQEQDKENLQPTVEEDLD